MFLTRGHVSCARIFLVQDMCFRLPRAPLASVGLLRDSPEAIRRTLGARYMGVSIVALPRWPAPLGGLRPTIPKCFFSSPRVGAPLSSTGCKGACCMRLMLQVKAPFPAPVYVKQLRRTR